MIVLQDRGHQQVLNTRTFFSASRANALVLHQNWGLGDAAYAFTCETLFVHRVALNLWTGSIQLAAFLASDPPGYAAFPKALQMLASLAYLYLQRLGTQSQSTWLCCIGQGFTNACLIGPSLLADAAPHREPAAEVGAAQSHAL